MAIAVAESPTTAIEDTTCVVTLGAATQGHTLVAMVGGRTTGDATISGSGWTEVVNAASASMAFQVWWKVAGASEPTSITFTWGGSVESIGCVVRLTGAHGTTPWINDSNGATGTDTTLEAGSAGGSGADFLIAAFWLNTLGAVVTDEQSYTQVTQLDGANMAFWLYTKADTSAASPVFGIDTSIAWAAFNSGWDEAIGTLLFRRRQMEVA